jgi:hypothetical protein
MASLYSDLHSEDIKNEEDESEGEILAVEGSTTTENTSKE